MTKRKLQVLDAMVRYGGGFVSALAEAWKRADPENDGRMMLMFGHYYRDYESRFVRPRNETAEEIDPAHDHTEPI